MQSVGAGAATGATGGADADHGSLGAVFPVSSLTDVSFAAQAMPETSTQARFCFQFVSSPDGSEVLYNAELDKATAISIFSDKNDLAVAQLMVRHAGMKNELDMGHTITAQLNNQQAPARTTTGALIPASLLYVAEAPPLSAAMGGHVGLHGDDDGVGWEDDGEQTEEEREEEQEEEEQGEHLQTSCRLREIRSFASLPPDLRVCLVDLMNLMYIVRVGGYPQAGLTAQRSWGCFVRHWDRRDDPVGQPRSLAMGLGYINWMLRSDRTAHIINSLANITGAYTSIVTNLEAIKAACGHAISVAALLHLVDQSARCLSLYHDESVAYNMAGCFFGHVTEDCIAGMIMFHDVKALHCNLAYDDRQRVLFTRALINGDFVGDMALTIYSPVNEYVYSLEAQLQPYRQYITYPNRMTEIVYNFLTFYVDGSDMTDQMFAEELAAVHEKMRHTKMTPSKEEAGGVGVTYHMMCKYRRARNFASNVFQDVKGPCLTDEPPCHGARRHAALAACKYACACLH